MTQLPTFAESVADTDILLIQRHSVEFSFRDILIFNGNRSFMFPLEKRLRTSGRSHLMGGCVPLSLYSLLEASTFYYYGP